MTHMDDIVEALEADVAARLAAETTPCPDDHGVFKPVNRAARRHPKQRSRRALPYWVAGRRPRHG